MNLYEIDFDKYVSESGLKTHEELIHDVKLAFLYCFKDVDSDEKYQEFCRFLDSLESAFYFAEKR